MKFILIPLVIATILLSININKPFVGHHDFMSAFEGIIAKNYLKHGYSNLKFGGLLTHPESIQENKSFSTHHPQLYPILISLSFLIFGTQEWSLRLVPFLFSLIGVTFLFLICQKLWNKNIALLGSLFFVLNPMFIYFGTIPILDFAVLYLMLAVIYFYLSWIERGDRKYFLSVCGIIFIAGLIDWTIVYLPPLLIFHSLIIKKFDPKLILSVVVALLTVIILLFHNFILTGEWISREILKTVQFRLTEKSLSFGGEEFNLINYLKREISWLQAYFTRTVLVLSAFFVFLNLNLIFNPQKIMVLIFLVLGLAHPVIFSRYVFIHDFLNIYFLPFLAVSAALGLNMIIQFLQKIKINRVVIFSLVIVVFMLFITEKLQFSKALIKTDMNKQGKEMARLLNSLQGSANQAVVVSPRFESFYGVFTNYYSKYPYLVLSEQDLKRETNFGKYKYIIMIDEDIKDGNFFQNLTSNYKIQKKGEWNIISINEQH